MPEMKSWQTRMTPSTSIRMKCLFMLAVLLPFVLGAHHAHHERFLTGNNQLNQPDLDKVIQLVRGFAKSDMGQRACVIACRTAVRSTGYGFLLTFLCPAACERVRAQLK
ncbi:uncharacterized protein LOC134690869 [Mytilus trossulus]|uniref:uncharacterized protein LOC134690869 n=1 Tax=Mytilus trossulus TaxID=6551 RepID=UPI003006EF12